jgi:hypothetical protein
MRKALICFFLAVGCSTFAVGQQAHSGVQEAQQKAKTSGRQTDQRQASGPKQPSGGGVLSKTNHPLPLPKPQTHHAAPSATQARSAGAIQSSNTAARALNDNHATSNLRSVQLHTAPRAAAHSPGDVRHHSPNPAILGGSGNSSVANTGGLNGTHMSRRP